MSTLVDRPSRARPHPDDVLPSPWTAGAIAAAQAAAGSLVVALVPVVATWVVTGGGVADWRQVVRLAVAAWLLAQHGGLAVDGGHLGIVPLGFAAVPVLSCWFAGRRLARTLDARGLPVRALSAMVAGHALLATLAGALAATPAVRPVLWQAAVGPAVVAAVGGTLGAAGYLFGGARAGLRGLLELLPAVVRGWLAPAGAVLAVLLAAAGVTLLVALALGATRVVALHAALGADLLGSLVLVVVQLAFTPNLLIWTAAALVGPGFSVGAGSTVSPAASTLGPLPALPVLAALPDPGPLPTVALVVLLVPLLAGAVGGLLLVSRLPPEAGRWALARDVAGLVALSALGFGVLGWLSGGPAGPGRLAVTGPSPLLISGVLAAQVLVGALLAVFVRRAAPALAEAAAARRVTPRRRR